MAIFKILLCAGSCNATNIITAGEYLICKPTDLTGEEIKTTILICYYTFISDNKYSLGNNLVSLR